MRTVRPARWIVAIFAMFATAIFLNARTAFAQDADSGASVSGISVDSSWESTAPALDVDAAAADKVLELPRVTCADGTPSTCDSTGSDGADPDDQTINAPSPSSPPTLDDDTASSGAPSNDWGDADDYQNQGEYAVPYGVYPYVVGSVNRPSNVPGSAYVSSPITQAARPPLNPGPWMLSPSTSMYSRPAGSPMMAFTFHH